MYCEKQKLGKQKAEMRSEIESQRPEPELGVDLSTFSTGGFERGAGRLKELCWLVVSLFLFQLCPLKLSALKAAVLRWFGALVEIGRAHV